MSDLIDTFANRLTYALKIRNMKPIELAEKTKISKSKISSYMSGRYKAKTDGLKILADALDVSPVWLMGYDVSIQDEKEKNNKDNYFSLLSSNSKQVFPILGTVKAGYDYLANENIIGYVNIDKDVPDPENYFALKVTGDSMQPILYEDDIVVIHKQNDIENGQIGIFLLNKEEATIKKYIKEDNIIKLVAFNQYYPIKEITKNDNFIIIGRVVEGRITKVFE